MCKIVYKYIRFGAIEEMYLTDPASAFSEAMADMDAHTVAPLEITQDGKLLLDRDSLDNAYNNGCRGKPSYLSRPPLKPIVASSLN